MARSICQCTPHYASAGENNTWTFTYTAGNVLPKGALLKFDLASDGRAIDWEIPEAGSRKTGNVIYGTIGNGKVLHPKEMTSKDDPIPCFEFTLPQKLSAGENFTIVIGTPQGKEKAKKPNGNHAQTYSQRRRPFYLYIDPKGKGNYEEPEVFSIDVRGNELKNIKINTPSFVTKNRRFDVTVRFEDKYGNLTSTSPDDDTLIELSHEYLRENLNWKLFIPETGLLTLPNLYFNEEGVYTIQLKNLNTKETFYSPPIKCFIGEHPFLYWGVIHGESEKVDSTINIESCLRCFRDEEGLQFYSASPFEDAQETPAEVWKLISNHLPEFNEEDRFSTFFGMQWAGSAKSEGVRQFLFAKEAKQMIRKKESKYNSLKKIYRAFAPKELISIPCFTMGKGYEYDFKQFSPEFERVVEIYNSWGSSECTEKDGNPCPIQPLAKKGIVETAEGSIQEALKNNHRFGFVAGGLDDRGIYSDFYDNEQCQYPAGLTGILAKEHKKETLFNALYNRSCYATTGKQVLLGFNIAGFSMGSEISTLEKKGLLVNRHISGFVAGTTSLSKIEIIRNGEVIKTFETDDYSMEFAYDDMIALDKVSLTPDPKKPPFSYYYLRVTQEDGHMAWGSPIWVDIT